MFTNKKIISRDPVEMDAITQGWISAALGNTPLSATPSYMADTPSLASATIAYKARRLLAQLAANDYQAAIGSYVEAYRVQALMQMRTEFSLSSAEYGALLRHVLLLADQPGRMQDEYQKALALDTDRKVMTEAEMVRFMGLPWSEVRVYRGIGSCGSDGLNWTLSSDVARRYSALYGGSVYLFARVSKPGIAALIERKGYTEIILRNPLTMIDRIELDACRSTYA